MRSRAAQHEHRFTLSKAACALLAVAIGGFGGVMTKRATPAPAPVMAVVEREAPAVRVIAASIEEEAGFVREDVVEQAAEATPPEVTIEVVEIEDPLAGRSVEPTRWTDENGVVWETAAEGFERYYNGRPLVRVKTLWMTTTAYSPDHRSCGIWADGITASMRSVWTNGMELVAADRRVLDFGSLVSIPGYAGERAVPVLDVGGAIKGARLDLLYPTHRRALKWGVQKLPVTVWAYADEIEG